MEKVSGMRWVMSASCCTKDAPIRAVSPFPFGGRAELSHPWVGWAVSFISAHVVVLGLRSEFANRHVFDHAPAQRADGLLGHGGAPVLSEVVETLDLKTGRFQRVPSYAVG